MLRLTCEALAVSLLRYGLTIVGSGLSDKAMSGLDTCVLNIMARKISGVPRTARVSVLRAVSGALSAHNLFIQHCALMVDLGLRASGSTLQRCLNSWLCRIFGVRSWEAGTRELTLPPNLPPHIARLRYLDFDVSESWGARTLESTPQPPSWIRISPVYHSSAPEITTNPGLHARTYGYLSIKSWSGIGAQVLLASGWRPDCRAEKVINTARMPPPRTADFPLSIVI